MHLNGSATPNRSFAALKRFVRPQAPVERCEMCGVVLGPGHEHLLEPASRRMICACGACALLFDHASGTNYRRISRRVRFLTDFQLSDSQWDSLLIPINMAFFYTHTPAGKVIAMYPSPAGATESTLPLDTWDEVVANNPILRSMEPDVEALLVQRLSGAGGRSRPEHYLAPIDECYRLVGLIRTHWRGLSGGTEVWKEIEAFFVQLREKCGNVACLAKPPGLATGGGQTS